MEQEVEEINLINVAIVNIIAIHNEHCALGDGADHEFLDKLDRMIDVLGDRQQTIIQGDDFVTVEMTEEQMREAIERAEEEGE